MAARAFSRQGAIRPTPYEQHRDYVLRVLAKRCRWLERDEREEAFHEAYAVVLEKQRAGQLDIDSMPAQQIRAFLTQTAIHKALDEGKRAGRKRSVPLGDAEFTAPDHGRPPDELAAAGMDGARVREIVGELSTRKQAIVKLRYFFDRSPAEIQRCLGISERAYRRDLERAMKHILERYELVDDGTFCATRRSVILAFVTGVAGPTRARVAREHIATCPSCSKWAAELREAAGQVAGVVPLPALAVDDGPVQRLLHSSIGLRNHLFDAIATAKQHAMGIAARVDQASAGYAAAARPGAAAMAVAGCVTLGGGVTYCAVKGVPEPVRELAQAVGVEKPKRPPPKPRPRPVVPRPAPIERQAPQPPPPRNPSPPARSVPDPAPPAPAKPAPAPPAEAPAVDQEFGFETPAPPPSPAAPPRVPTSPPPPASPPGEFDP